MERSVTEAPRDRTKRYAGRPGACLLSALQPRNPGTWVAELDGVVSRKRNRLLPPTEDPQQAFRLLRHLRLAEVLWGNKAALPIAALETRSRLHRIRALRALLQLEREGAVVLHRVTRAVRLHEPAMRVHDRYCAE